MRSKAAAELNAAREQIRVLLVRHGFSEAFADVIRDRAGTPYTAGRMLGYLRNYRPHSEEEVIDELLSIYEKRDQYVKKQIVRKNTPGSDPDSIAGLFLKRITIDWSSVEDSYVRRIPALSGLDALTFTGNLTFFVGENGSGKSTLLEAIAIACGFNPEGGTRNYRFSTYDDYSGLAKSLHCVGGPKPAWGFFLRAESFYNVASTAMTEYNDDGKMTDFHAQSHGESFLEFIQQGAGKGLYLLDEPEAALSPQRQLSLLIHLKRMAEAGSQYIIISHSPILLGIPGARILSFDDGKVHEISYEETESYQITKLFLENREYFLERLRGEEETEVRE